MNNCRLKWSKFDNAVTSSCRRRCAIGSSFKGAAFDWTKHFERTRYSASRRLRSKLSVHPQPRQCCATVELSRCYSGALAVRRPLALESIFTRLRARRTAIPQPAAAEPNHCSERQNTSAASSHKVPHCIFTWAHVEACKMVQSNDRRRLEGRLVQLFARMQGAPSPPIICVWAQGGRA